MTPEYKAIKNILYSDNQIADESLARQFMAQLLPYSAHWDDCCNDIYSLERELIAGNEEKQLHIFLRKRNHVGFAVLGKER